MTLAVVPVVPLRRRSSACDHAAIPKDALLARAWLQYTPANGHAQRFLRSRMTRVSARVSSYVFGRDVSCALIRYTRAARLVTSGGAIHAATIRFCSLLATAEPTHRFVHSVIPVDSRVRSGLRADELVIRSSSQFNCVSVDSSARV